MPSHANEGKSLILAQVAFSIFRPADVVDRCLSGIFRWMFASQRLRPVAIFVMGQDPARSRRSLESTFGAPIEGGSNLSRDGINCLGIQDWLSDEALQLR